MNDMKSSEFEKLKELIRNYIQLLEKEYTYISEILCLSDSFSGLEKMRMRYVKRLEQIRELLDRNSVLFKTMEYIESMELAMNCASPGLDSMFGIDFLSDEEPGISEKESFISEIDPHVKNDQEKNDLRRKKLADALRNGELVTISPDGQITDTSAFDDIATFTDPFVQSNYINGSKPIDMAIAAGDDTSDWDDDVSELASIQVPDGKLAGGHGMCRICGTVFNQITNYCPECGTKVVIEKPVVSLDKVQFSAIAPKTIVKGDYSVIEIIMYENTFRHVVEEAIENAEEPVKETKSGLIMAEKNAEITVKISSPDFEIEDNTESQTWQGEHLSFSFAVEVPEQYKKKQILFVASVYINDIIATRLKFVVKCKSLIEQKIEVTRDDVLSAFVSYASQDRNRVAMIIQGMKKARPDMDIFFDVDSLRSGDDWEKTLWHEIDKRDVLFLCWSKYAKDSKWVDAEWRYAFKNKGAESIEPVPIDPPSSCPPPDELSRKHFNDKLLYIINTKSESSVETDELTWCDWDETW